jgi:inosose dehydratase
VSGLWSRVAGAPITWGVCEVRDWGHQFDSERVLSDMQRLGLGATELGPDGFLPEDPAALRALLARFGLRLVAGFVPVALHRAAFLPQALALADVQARRLAAGGAEVLVVAVSGHDGYDESEPLDAAAWPVLCEGLARIEELAADHGLRAALHPHYGTAIERPAEIWHVLERSGIGLCLDTGHLLVGGLDPLELTAAAADRVLHVHLKDVDGRLAEQVRDGALAYRTAVGKGLYVPLGDGDADVRGLIERVERSGYAGWYVLEQDTILPASPGPEDDPFWAAEASVAYLRMLIGDQQGAPVTGTGPAPLDASKDP